MKRSDKALEQLLLDKGATVVSGPPKTARKPRGKKEKAAAPAHSGEYIHRLGRLAALGWEGIEWGWVGPLLLCRLWTSRGVYGDWGEYADVTNWREGPKCE